MNQFSELFGDEISDLKQLVKSEEEIKKYCTNEDMGELKRSVFLLKKGYQCQKITIIENLYRLMREPGANEELLPIILSSMEIWDEKMQTECARNFQKDQVIKQMNSGNQVRLMEECLNIILNADIAHEEFINEWVKVYKLLVIYLPIDHLKQHMIKRIVDLPSLKQPYPWRRIGFDMFCGLADAKGEEGFKSDPSIIKIFTNMCTDTNWKIRKQAAQFLYLYLQPLHSMTKKTRRVHNEEEKVLGRSPSKQTQSKSILVQAEVVKVTKQRFKEQFYDIMVELAADEEALVQIEGIEIMIEYMKIIKKAILEKDFLPQLEKMLILAEDTITDDEIRIRMAKACGPALEKIAALNLQIEFEQHFMNYFRSIIKDKNPEVKKWAAFNMPCFYLQYRNTSESNMLFFDTLYFELVTDTNSPLEVLKTLASGIHEALAIIPRQQSIGQLKDCLKLLMSSNHKTV